MLHALGVHALMGCAHMHSQCIMGAGAMAVMYFFAFLGACASTNQPNIHYIVQESFSLGEVFPAEVKGGGQIRGN